MKVADMMIGNSSSGIIESPSFKLPVVNIGPRQQGRECAENVLHVHYSKNEIVNAINKCLYDSEFRKKVSNCKNPYGQGNTSKIICDTLRQLDISNDLFLKSINYD
jgi:UDP-N-acetylglucosamine 2-epimerase (non-hydrolysing)/GDP/UDP-N,N'-diacetylbacillosamine 2-epimerase (hydrolysing)